MTDRLQKNEPRIIRREICDEDSQKNSYHGGCPRYPQSLNAVFTGILPAPALKKVDYPVTATVHAQLKTTGEWFEGTGTFKVTVHKAK